MKIKNVTLNEARKEAFDEALADYDFGAEFIGNDSITKDDNIWSCKVYLFDEEIGETLPYSFTVEFKEDSAEVEYLSYDLI
jgi:choline kinase